MRVGVVFGGQSGEHEVSLASARSIMAVMDRNKYEIVPIGIAHSGQWLTSGDPLGTLSVASPGGDAETRRSSRDAGDDSRPARRGRELLPGAQALFPSVDVVLPVLHGPYGEDGTIQGLLELAGLPYVGCGVLASALAMDKIASKQVFISAGLPVPAYRAFKRKAWEESPDAVVADLEVSLSYPMFVKPANLGSSIGISKVRTQAQLRSALAEAARYDRRLLIEQAIPNAREIECSVLGNDDPIASVPGEIVSCNEFYDYAAKYLDDRSQLLIPAPISAETANRVHDLALRAFLAIDGAGLARVDFLLDAVTGELFISEVNTMPGFTQISMYPKLWAASGIPYAELIDRLIELAQERSADKRCSSTTYGNALPASPAAG